MGAKKAASLSPGLGEANAALRCFIRFFQVYLSMIDVPCNLVAALVSGVRYSQGSGAYQSSVRNRSKLVVNSVGKPANMLVNQGFGGIIENFLIKMSVCCKIKMSFLSNNYISK